MPNATQVQPSFSFVKGIITEASPLTYPENATIDEENFDLDVSGKRQRRLGIDFENNYQYITSAFGTGNTLDNYKIQTYRWDNVGRDSTKSFLVVRIGTELRFFDLFESTQSVNEINKASNVVLNATDSKVSFTDIDGYLVIVEDSYSFTTVLEYSGSSVIKTTSFVPQVRDFWGIEDGLAIDERPTAPLSTAHTYNLKNQGWSSDKINNFAGLDYGSWISSSYYGSGTRAVPTTPNGFFYESITTTTEVTTGTTEPTWPTTLLATVVDGDITWVCKGETTGGLYPSNADLISLGEKTDGSWDSSLIKDYLLGTTEAPKGKYILDLFSMGSSRQYLSGLSFSTTEYIENGGISACASYAGRLFLGGVRGTTILGDNKSPTITSFILFSQLVKNVSDFSKYYQSADPTAEEINELVDTDGGFISIPETSSIHKLVPVGQSLMVFAENGVWEVRGGESGFSATDYQVRKITNIGSISPFSVVEAEGTVFYFSKSGIYAIQPDKTQTMYVAENISEATIQTLYLNIPSTSKEKAQGHFEPENRRVRWMYNSNSAEDKYVYNKEIILDLQLGAFYKHGYPTGGTTSPQLASFYSTPNFTVQVGEEDVITAGGETVTDITLETVTVQMDRRQGDLSSLKYVSIENPGASNWRFTFSSKDNTDYKDWATFGDNVDASAYMETGYNISGDSMRYKQVPYITFHFSRTETGFDSSFNPLNPSSCLVTPYWDWADSTVGGKIGTQFQAYRLNRNYIPVGSGDSFNYGQVVVSTKSKLRGRGRSLSLRIDTEADKDCQLLGWSLTMTGNTVV